MKVKLNDIACALQMQFDEQHSYVDLDTGEVVTVSEEYMKDSPEDPGAPEWEKDVRQVARRVATRTGSWSFRTSSMWMSGKSFRSFDSPWSQSGLRGSSRSHPRRQGVPAF